MSGVLRRVSGILILLSGILRRVSGILILLSGILRRISGVLIRLSRLPGLFCSCPRRAIKLRDLHGFGLLNEISIGERAGGIGFAARSVIGSLRRYFGIGSDRLLLGMRCVAAAAALRGDLLIIFRPGIGCFSPLVAEGGLRDGMVDFRGTRFVGEFPVTRIAFPVRFRTRGRAGRFHRRTGLGSMAHGFCGL